MSQKLLTLTKCVICHKPMLASEHTLDAYPYRIAKKGEPNWCCEKWQNLTLLNRLRCYLPMRKTHVFTMS
jgi:hypothetical protein